MRNLTIAFLAAEGLSAIAWWISLAVSPAVRAVFFPGPIERGLIGGLLAPDLLVFAGSAFAGAVALLKRHSWSGPLLWLHVGAALYAGVFAIGLAVSTGAGWLGAAMMAPSVVILPYLVCRLHPRY